MIIWSRLGILWPVCAVLGGYLAMMAAEKLELPLHDHEASTGMYLLWGAVLGGWICHTSICRKDERGSHSIFFIPVKFFTVALALFTIAMTYFIATGKIDPSSADADKSDTTAAEEPTAPTPKPTLPSAEREWTSSDGKVMRASLLSISGDDPSIQVRIRRDDGEEFTLPATRLSPEDQTFIERHR